MIRQVFWFLVLQSFLVFSTPVWAIECRDVFDGLTNGIRPGLVDEGFVPLIPPFDNALDPWPGNGTELSGNSYFYAGGTYQYRTLELASQESSIIYVQGDLTFGEGIKINQTGLPGSLLIVVDGNFTTTANASSSDKKLEIQAFIYVTGNVSLSNNDNIKGGIAAGGSISVGNKDVTEYTPGLEASLENEFCKPTTADVEIDHFEISHNGIALTCQPETIEIRACADADINCTNLVTDISAVSLAPSSGWIGGSEVALENGRGSASIQITDFEGEVFSAILAVTGSTPSVQPQSETMCEVGGSISAENCELLFYKSGLAFDVPPLISHRPSGPLQLRAVRQDKQTPACVAAFQDRTEVFVQFSSAYVSPNADNRDISREVRVKGTSVSRDSNSPTGIELSFDKDGVAEIDVSYLDAGKVQLSAVYYGSEASNDAGLIMPGVDSFVAIPAGFCVTSGGDCAVGDSSCPPFRKAGELFDLSIQAVGWQSDTDSDFCTGNPTTPNFTLTDIPLQVELVEPNEVGAVPGELPDERKTYSHNRATDATKVVTLSQSQVGVFRFKTAPEPGAYLERDLPKAVSQPIGRFHPARFRVAIEKGELGGECEPDTFVYSGQEFSWKMAASALIEPLSVQGDVTTNYTFDGFRRLFEDDITRSGPEELVAINNDKEPMEIGSDMAAVALPVVGPGQMEYRYHSDDKFWYEKTLAARRAPFDPDIQLALSDIEDSDGVKAELSRYEFSPEMSAEIRYGRLVMENVYGPENLELPLVLRMPFEIEVLDDERFVLHAEDSCNSWNTDGIDVVEAPARHTLTSDSGTFVGGKGEPLSISPLGERGADILEWGVDAWLKDFWGREPVEADDPALNDLQNPRATATFGVYRGHDRIIYWREVRD